MDARVYPLALIARAASPASACFTFRRCASIRRANSEQRDRAWRGHENGERNGECTEVHSFRALVTPGTPPGENRCVSYSKVAVLYAFLPTNPSGALRRWIAGIFLTSRREQLYILYVLAGETRTHGSRCDWNKSFVKGMDIVWGSLCRAFGEVWTF